MIEWRKLVVYCSVICLFPLYTYATATVIDDSEHFTLAEQSTITEPVKGQQQNSQNTHTNEIESALAKDIDNNSNINTNILGKLAIMQQELQELRGLLEIYAHDLKLLKQQQLTFYKDLDSRIQGTEALQNKNKISTDVSQHPINSPDLSIDSTENNPAVSRNTNRGNPADEQISYLAAYDLVKHKRFDEALVAMTSFTNHYPQGGYTANAQYWLGELYMVKNNYPKAIEHFEMVLQQYPGSSKAAASTLKIGYALAASGKTEEAKIRLQEVLRNYPDTPTAQLAIMKLDSLKIS